MSFETESTRQFYRAFVPSNDLAITQQPASARVVKGSSVQLVFGATGSITGKFWLKDGFEFLENFDAAPWSTNFVLSLTNVTAKDSGKYSAAVFSAYHAKATDVAVLEVYEPPVAGFAADNIFKRVFLLHPESWAEPFWGGDFVLANLEDNGRFANTFTTKRPNGDGLGEGHFTYTRAGDSTGALVFDHTRVGNGTGTFTWTSAKAGRFEFKLDAGGQLMRGTFEEAGP